MNQMKADIARNQIAIIEKALGLPMPTGKLPLVDDKEESWTYLNDLLLTICELAGFLPPLERDAKVFYYMGLVEGLSSKLIDSEIIKDRCIRLKILRMMSSWIALHIRYVFQPETEVTT